MTTKRMSTPGLAPARARTDNPQIPQGMAHDVAMAPRPIFGPTDGASSTALGPVLDRRRFLSYLGAGVGLLVSACAGKGRPAIEGPGKPWVTSDGSPDWQAVPYPVPLPGDPGPASGDAARLAEYTVVDDLLVPEGFQVDIIARWGDRFGAEGHTIDFGFNNDYTGLFPIAGSETDYWLFVNHEYISGRPWLQGYEEVKGETLPDFRLQTDPEEPWRFKYGQLTIDGWTVEDGNMINLAAPRQEIPPEIRSEIQRTCETALSDLGVSILRVRRLSDGRFEVVNDATDHKRITGIGRQNIAGQPAEIYRFTGPAALLLDALPRGTFANCSGGTTPWGTFLTCEENFHYEANEEITPAGELIPDRAMDFGGTSNIVNKVLDLDPPLPINLNGLGFGLEEPIDGRAHGWVCEVDPETGHMGKHTSLGRFRHENVALRCEKGKPLAAYMGDDRRGGHIWKFVSEGVVDDPKDPANSRLFERGTLYAARFEEGYSGRWVALEPETPLRRPEPEQCFSAHIKVPSRHLGGFVGIGDTERDRPALEVDDWVAIIEDFAGKRFAECTLGDLVTPTPGQDEAETRERRRGVLVMDAFAMANAAGATPSARPEDLEIHPVDKSVYIAFTDSTDGSDGSPDRRIFPDSALENSRQYGAIYRIIENDGDPAATTFEWGKFVSSGEVAETGGGFANCDNLVFDPEGNLWMVTDISTSVLNFPVDRDISKGTQPGGKQFPGVFGNNAVFMIPTTGPKAGIPHCFAIGPVECEICGPTFTDDGRTLILSIQHPGERSGIRTAANPERTETYIIHDRDNQPFEQRRTTPIGSNYPTGELDRSPRPSVVCITRKS